MASDPLADFYNAMGLQGMVGPNPYLTYTGKIPMAGFYTGQGGNQPPTDAMGNPIQSFVDANNTAQSQYQQQLGAYNAQKAAAPTPGTTLNSTPGAGGTPYFGPFANQAAQTAAYQSPDYMSAIQANPPNRQPTQADFNNSLLNSMGGQVSQQLAAQSTYGGMGGTTMPGSVPGVGAQFGDIVRMRAMNNQLAGGGGAPAGPTPPSPPDMRQAYLDALANPGKVNTPGAQLLPGTSLTGPIGANQQPSVMQAFLAAHPGGGTTGAGGFTNKPFFNTLAQLQQGGQQ
jgi:hypothetical protein